MAYLFKYDSVHGTYKGTVDFDKDNLIVDGEKIKVFQERDPLKIDWESIGATYVCESTGFFTKKKMMQKNI